MDNTTTKINVEFSLPDATTAAAKALDRAYDYAASKMKLADAEATADLLRQRNPNARSYFEYGLARELAEHLGAIDDQVQAVYMYDAEATSDDLAFAEGSLPQLHLIIWAERKTQALDSVLSAMGRAIAERYAQVMEMAKPVQLIDTQVVNTAEVNSRSGFGAILASIYNRPLLIWKR